MDKRLLSSLDGNFCHHTLKTIESYCARQEADPALRPAQRVAGHVIAHCCFQIAEHLDGEVSETRHQTIESQIKPALQSALQAFDRGDSVIIAALDGLIAAVRSL